MRRSLCIGICLLLTSGPAFGQFQDIENPVHSVGVEVTAGQFSFNDGDFGFGADASKHVFEDVEFPTGEQVTGFAQARTNGDPLPALHVHAGVLASSVPPFGVIPTGVRAHAGATLTYNFRINQDQTPPANPSNLPVQVNYVMTADATGYSVNDNAGYSMEASLDVSALLTTGPRFLFMDRIALNTLDGNTIVASPNLNVPPGSQPFPVIMASRFVIHQVTMRGGAAVGAAGNVHSSEIVLEIDPMLSFHQPTFDEMMGDNTFNLADFYSFEFSPGISNVRIPEPSSPLLTIFAGLICCSRRRRV